MTFTVFTPAYNRGDMLNRVYRSLLDQKNKDFEWLIVDDGSSDNTESIVNDFIAENHINIRYIKKENGGKHTAHNVAVNNANGEWFICLDSDDILSLNAIELLSDAIKTTIDTDCGIICKKSTMDGALLSSSINATDKHYGMYRYFKDFGGCGEYTLVFKTEVLLSYLYPEIENEKFMGECVLYDRLEIKGYTLAVLNEIIEICEYQEDGLTGNIINCLKQSPTAYQIYHSQRIDLVDTFKERLGHVLKYHAFKTLSRNREYLYKGKHSLFVALMTIPGMICSLYYKFK